MVKQAERVLKITYLVAKEFKSSVIDTGHLLLAILKDRNNMITSTMERMGVQYIDAKNEYLIMNMEENDITSQSNFPPEDNPFESSGSEYSSGNPRKVKESKSSHSCLG